MQRTSGRAGLGEGLLVGGKRVEEAGDGDDDAGGGGAGEEKRVRERWSS